jgi:hypothetical protein
MLVQAVVDSCHAGSAALGGDGVAAHGIDLGDDPDAEVGVLLGDGYRGAQPGAAAADHHNVVPRGHWGLGSGLVVTAVLVAQHPA